MNRPFTYALAALIAACCCLCAGCERGSVGASPLPSSTPSPLPTATAQPITRVDTDYAAVRVYFDSLLSDRAYEKDGVAYMSPSALCAFFGLEGSVTEERGGGFSGSIGSVKLSAKKGLEYMTADSRYLYIPGGYITVGGEVYIPCKALCHIFGLTAVVQEEPLRVDIATAGMALISGGEDYYNTHFIAEDVYWLARLIHSEAKNQPLAGLIGVGNVVLNRVKSTDFPNTVLAVVFDKNYGLVQFESTVTGGILETPNEESTIATYLCLEGFNTVGESLYYVNPVTGYSYWFETALTRVVAIGNHTFYK